MASRASLAPPNSVILVGDPTQADVPSTMAGQLVASTDTCVAVGVRSEVDGATEFTLGIASEVDPGYAPRFIGILKTPSRRIAIRTVLGDVVLETLVSREETRIHLWANDETEPDQIAVGVLER